HIWDCLFSPQGLVREYGATVILTTHSLKYLKFADQILILGDNGHIASQGNFDTIRESAYLQSLSFEDAQPKDAKDAETISVAKSRQQSQPQTKGVEAESELDLLRKAGDTTLYWYYLKSIGWWYGSAGAISLILDCFFRVFPQIWLKIWTEEDARTGSSDTGFYFGVYSAISVVGLFVIGVNIWIMFVLIVPKSSQSLHWTLLQSVMRAPLSFFGSTDTGDLINRFSQDLSHIDRDLPTALFMTSIGEQLLPRIS
ncbi:ABC transporter, partial [Colletotrichum simmondsii]